MSTKAEEVILALVAVLETVAGAKVLRNAAPYESIPDGGLIIVRDGDPFEPEDEQLLNDDGPFYYVHPIPVELYVQDGDRDPREAAFADLSERITAAIVQDKTLGGLVEGLTQVPFAGDTELVQGAADIKAATKTVTPEYQTDTPL